MANKKNKIPVKKRQTVNFPEWEPNDGIKRTSLAAADRAITAGDMVDRNRKYHGNSEMGQEAVRQVMAGTSPETQDFENEVSRRASLNQPSDIRTPYKNVEAGDAAQVEKRKKKLRNSNLPQWNGI